MTTNTPWTGFPAMAVAGAFAGIVGLACVPARQACPIGERVVEVPVGEACPLGFADLDGDGSGGSPDALCPEDCGTGATCSAPDFEGAAVSCDADDCQDEPTADNPHPELRFPGATEVCDGLDNDCDPETTIDWEDEAWVQNPGENATYSLSCARHTEIAFILDDSPLVTALLDVADGSNRRFERSTGTLFAHGGDTLGGEGAPLHLRSLRSRQGTAIVHSAVVWSGDLSVAWLSEDLSRPLNSTEVCTEPDLGLCMREKEVELLPALLVPEYVEPEGVLGVDPNTYYLTFIAKASCDPENVAALSNYDYCGGSNCPSECEAVFGDFPYEVTNESFGVDAGVDWGLYHPDAPLDATSLTDYDMATCKVFGSGTFPVLLEARDQNDEKCTLPSPAGSETCRRTYRDAPFACAYIKVVVLPDS